MALRLAKYFMKKTKKFDPDRLVLSKKEILEFCDKVLEKWKKIFEEQNIQQNKKAADCSGLRLDGLILEN